ncbi:hypothetical protein LDENG_00066350 [Lucifuga dentata]|nr:hypothetical protein LDENG_00066350 [Lucifuga dentata]
MKGDTTTAGNEEMDDNGEATENAFGERRPSIVKLQKMLKRVSQSPFHNQDKAIISSSSDSSGSSMNDQNKQNGVQELLHSSPRNGVSEAFARTNPFYTQYFESTNKSSHTEDIGRGSSEEENINGIFAPPSDFQSSPLDHQPESQISENEANMPKPQSYVFHHNRSYMQAALRTSQLAHNTTTNGFQFQSTTLKSPDIFKTNSHQPENLFKPSKSNLLLKAEAEDLFQAKREDSLHAAPTTEVNHFDKSPRNFLDPFKSSKKEEDLFQSTQSKESNPFYAATTKEEDLFQAVPNETEKSLFRYPSTKDEDPFDRPYEENLDIFSPLSKNPVDPFPSLTDSFQNSPSVDDVFGPTPLKQYNPFRDFSNGTPDIFQPLPSKTADSNGIFETTSANKATPSLKRPLEIKDTYTSSSSAADKSPELFKAKPMESHPAPSNGIQEIVLGTPPGTKHSVLQPTPFSQAKLPVSPLSQTAEEVTPVQPFKRPPKPLPRTRPPRLEKPPQPPSPVKTESELNEPKSPPKLAPKPLPKPVPRKKNTKDFNPVEPENPAVFEDILLLGQERCVEDWPEDSPQFSPDFKPTGKFRLRRESMRMDSEGGSVQDPDGSAFKKKHKLRVSVMSRSSKDKYPDDLKDEKRSRTLPIPRKPSKDYFAEMSTGVNEDEDQYGTDYKAQKKPLKAKVTKVLRRASTAASIMERKHMNGHSLYGSKEDGLHKKFADKENTITRRWSQGSMLDTISAGEKEGGEVVHEETDGHKTKKLKKVKIKFVPQRGFAITTEKNLKGPHGQTPRKGSKEKILDEDLGANGYTPPKKSQDDAFEDEEEEAVDYTLQPPSKAFTDAHKPSAGLTGDEEFDGAEDCKPKKPTKVKRLHVGRRRSKDDILGDTSSRKSKFSEDFDDEGEIGLEQGKPKKPLKLKMRKSKNKHMNQEDEDPPGATSSDYFLSEAAEAEWLAAQRDECAAAGMMDDGEEGDTDSLMEWWMTVEQWDEVPSDDEENKIKEDESKPFTILADKVYRGMRVFNKIFTERAEVLWQSIIMLHATADDISTFHHKAKIASITGGTTTAVGGVAAIAGLALAPVTFGASLLITAVGVGVATAGGITSASAAISDNVNNMHDRKKVEMVLQEYEAHLLDIAKVLHFVNDGLYRLRGHSFLRSGTQHYSEDWEVRKAVQMISLVDMPIMRATEIVDNTITSVQGLFKGMDRYFIKDSRELKKSCKKEIVSEIKEVANVLNDAIVELNAIREQLQDANGNF